MTEAAPASERPDELIQRAWNTGFDRKLVLREGTDAARYLLAGERNDFVNLFWPVPRRLEAVRLWSAHHSRLAAIAEELRKQTNWLKLLNDKLEGLDPGVKGAEPPARQPNL